MAMLMNLLLISQSSETQMNAKSTLNIVIGTAFAATVTMSPVANAAQNPFASVSLSQGYATADASDTTMSPDAKGASDKKMDDAKCSANKKTTEAKCSANKKASEAKCAAEKKASDAKCASAK
jgi:hypothetical protein